MQIAQNSIKYYTFIEPMLERCAAILSTSTRYEKMFEQDLRVQKALVNLYGEVSDFLQRLRRMLSSGCMSSDGYPCHLSGIVHD